ncbi:MAG: DUF3078 domain-containing protein [Rikenellaceae bacterium]
MKRGNLYTILFFVLLMGLSLNSYGQFTFNPTAETKTIETVRDSIKITGEKFDNPLSLSVNSDAYKKYVKDETFKYRNKLKFQSSVGITQTSFDNWAAGGSNSFSGRLWASLTHTYTNEETSFSVASKFEGAYTLVVSDGKASKSEDFMYISSTPSWKLASRWEVAGSLVFKSQFADGYTSDTVLTSSIFSPAYLTLSAGITYSPPSGRFKAYVAPISGNATFVASDFIAEKDLYGTSGKNGKAEFGAFSRIEFNQPMFKETTTFETTMESFWNYADCPTLWWESKLTYKLNSIFSIALYVKLMYDESVTTPRYESGDFWQFNQSLSFNFTFDRSSKENTGPLSF